MQYPYQYGMYPVQNLYQTQSPYQMQNATQVPAQRMEIIRVNGKGGADAFALAPNSSVLLLDESQSVIWLKTTDGAGFATTTPYTITPYQPEPQIDAKSLDERITRLEGLIGEQSNSRPVKRKSGDAEQSRAD